jgi:MOSC domain-containing protein YiiM
MRTIRDLAVPPQTGRIELIVVRGLPREPARHVQRSQALARIGLADDRLGQRGEAELSTRQVTLIQHEHLAVIAQLTGVPDVDAVRLRRNLVVSGINLLALKDQRVRIGGALLEITGPCAPCSRMEDEVGTGGYAAMRGHGGMTARVLESGWIEVGSAVRVEPADAADLAEQPGYMPLNKPV